MATTTGDEPQEQPLHFLFLPYFAPGHLIPVAGMAALFAARGARCTILTTPVNADIIRPAVDRANNANLDDTDHSTAIEIDIFVVPFPDVGLPLGFENLKYLTPSHGAESYSKFLHAGQLLRETFHRFLGLAASRPRVDAVVTDSFFAWSVDAATEHGVPRLVFLGSSVFARSCSDSTLRNNPLEAFSPHDDDDPDALVSLPGLPHRVQLTRRQMLDPRKRPGPGGVGVLPEQQRRRPEELRRGVQQLPGARAGLRGALPRHARPLATGGSSTDDSCLRWLDTKPAGSVVYISFGTLISFSSAELREIARGLDLSRKNFVWAISGTDDSSEWMPEGFAEMLARGDRGILIRGWAPQTLILRHPAVGGFVTHCGWNSELGAGGGERRRADGHVAAAWEPFHNEKLVVEVLKFGVSVGARDSATAVETHEVLAGAVIAGSITRLMSDDSTMTTATLCGRRLRCSV